MIYYLAAFLLACVGLVGTIYTNRKWKKDRDAQEARINSNLKKIKEGLKHHA